MQTFQTGECHFSVPPSQPNYSFDQKLVHMKLINLNLCVGTLILVIEKTSGVFPVMMISSNGFLQLTVIGGRDTGDCFPGCVS